MSMFEPCTLAHCTLWTWDASLRAFVSMHLLMDALASAHGLHCTLEHKNFPDICLDIDSCFHASIHVIHASIDGCFRASINGIHASIHGCFHASIDGIHASIDGFACERTRISARLFPLFCTVYALYTMLHAIRHSTLCQYRVIGFFLVRAWTML